MIQMTMKSIENEILLLDHSLDKQNALMTNSLSNSSSVSLSNHHHNHNHNHNHNHHHQHQEAEACEKMKAQKEHSLEDAKRMHEDLEFQLMELEAKYETELEDIQNRLIKEQDSLLNAFKQRQSNLNEYDQHQTKMLMQVKAETECLEMERQKLIEKFKKQRSQLQLVEKKLAKLTEEKHLKSLNSEETSSPVTSSDHVSTGIERSPSKMDFLQQPNREATEKEHDQEEEEEEEYREEVDVIENKNSDSNSQNNENTPSPASSSISISSSGNTSSENTDKQQQLQKPQQQQQQQSNLSNHQFSKCSLSLSPTHLAHNQPQQQRQQQMTSNILSPNRFIPSLLAHSHNHQSNNRYLTQQQQNIFLLNQHQSHIQLQQHLKQIQHNSHSHQQYANIKKQNLSQSFKDILENTLMINNLNENNTISNKIIKNNKNNNNTSGNNSRYVKNLNKSTCSLNLNGNHSSIAFSPQHQKLLSDAILLSQLPSTNLIDIDETDALDTDVIEIEQTIMPPQINGYNNDSRMSLSPTRHDQCKIPSTPVLVNNQMAVKFAQLERTLEITKAQNNNLLEQQLQARERELKLLQGEKKKREDLEHQLNLEIQIREKIVQENIKLRDKKTTQARPLTRYLPVRDTNFDLKNHVENSGHQLMNQIDPSTKQPLIFVNSNTCRGYLYKMGQKFKTWNKRWFVFDRTKRTLCYYIDKHETKLRGSIYFQSISEVYVDHMRTIKNSPDNKSTFVVKTFDRNFYFVAPSGELMRIWVDVIFTGAEGYHEFND
jgi:hypothetical protein